LLEAKERSCILREKRKRAVFFEIGSGGLNLKKTKIIKGRERMRSELGR